MEITGKIGRTTEAQLEQFKKYITLYWNHYQRFPSMDWLLKKTGQSKTDINGMIQTLINSRFLTNQNGVLSIYTPPKSQPQPKRTYQKRTQENEPVNNWIDSLRYILLVIGSGAMYMSIDYTYIYFSGFMGWFKAFLLSFIMVVFAVSSFELIIIFKRQKQYFLAGLFLFLWVIVTGFSMFSTIAGQYNAKIPEIQAAINSQNKQVFYQKQENKQFERDKRIDEKINTLKLERDRYLKMLSEYNTQEKIEKNKRFYGSLKWEYQKTQNQISAQEKLLSIPEQQKEKPPVKVKSIESWFGNLFGFNAAWVQFWLSLIPAIFIDLIAPFAFMIVMFLRKNNKNT